jgi:dTDP-4-amino-4,6-dideoxy-D-galactose acyltransferase
MPETLNEPGQVLEWDSQFFGRRIGRLTTNQLSREWMPQIDSWCRREQIDCLYFLAGPNDAETSRLASENQFQFVDGRVTLDMEIIGDTCACLSNETSAIREAKPGDLPALRDMAGRLHQDSRFFFDERFGKTMARRLFETWIEKSCAASDGRVFVADSGGRAGGYVAFRQPHAGLGQIELLAVDEFAQGQGLGRQLMAASLRWMKDQKIGRVVVVTQERNIRAQRLYQRSGFATCSVELWYHRWFDHRKETPS